MHWTEPRGTRAHGEFESSYLESLDVHHRWGGGGGSGGGGCCGGYGGRAPLGLTPLGRLPDRRRYCHLRGCFRLERQLSLPCRPAHALTRVGPKCMHALKQRVVKRHLEGCAVKLH